MTMKDVLTRKYLKDAVLIAGQAGLNRLVKWVHCMEVTQVSHLLKGHELVLTTGLGWNGCEETLHSFVEQLIRSNVAGLCVELGVHARHIPDPVLTLADKHNFPLIVFREEVPFVEITQDIHSLIINQQYALISNLEVYSQELNKILLTIDHYEPILKSLHNHLRVQVFLKIHEYDIYTVPRLKEPKGAYEKAQVQLKEANGNVMQQSIRILGENYAQLIISSKERLLTEYDALIMDRTVTALTQHLLRDLYIEEKKLSEGTQWMTDWLNGQINEEEIFDQLSYRNLTDQLMGGVVCICKQKPPFKKNRAKIDSTYFKMLFRTVFEQQGFYLFTLEVKNQLVFILGDMRANVEWKHRVQSALNRMKQLDGAGRNRLGNISIAVGKYVANLYTINRSYETAKEAMLLQDMYKKDTLSFFYQDLHMYRMLSIIDKNSNFKEIIYEHLGPVIEYDKKYNGELLPTLKTYLACNGSKQETSKQLYIVRQTLYHRLEKLEKLLGADFMQVNKRLPLELMVFAYDYLGNNERINWEYAADK